MQNDTRDKNITFPTNSPITFLLGYADKLKQGLSQVAPGYLQEAVSAIKIARNSSLRVFSAGNGGSAAIADHLVCDFTKGTCCPPLPMLQSQSLVSNVSVLTAIANDIEYAEIFSEQLKFQELKPGEVVILVSSSGNSPNIVKAAEFAITKRARVIGLTGFAGGDLYKMAEIKLHVPIHNYGVVEDCHQAIMHILAQYIYLTSKGL